jgi:flavin-dependent dehydrogenase
VTPPAATALISTTAPASPPTFDIAVLGNGPAGIAAACHLRKLGYSVALFGRRPVKANIEGISPRAHELLTASGLEATSASVSIRAIRTGEWGGTPVALSREHIIDRSIFDQALWVDATAQGIVLHPHLVIAIEPHQHRWRVRTSTAEVECRAIIDARGRRSGRILDRGPHLIAITQRLGLLAPQNARTLIQPLPHGWCWFASDGHGTGVLQLTTTPKEVASQPNLSRHVLDCMPHIPALSEVSRRATPLGAPQARAATARHCAPSDAPGYLRCGDAVIAGDPLSGHGIYEALRSARLAAAAAHTYLDQDSWTVVARFLTETAADRWHSTVTLTARFHQQQAVHTPTRFWTNTAAAYAALSASAQPTVESIPASNSPYAEPGLGSKAPRFGAHPLPRSTRIERRPVSNAPRIEPQPASSAPGAERRLIPNAPRIEQRPVLNGHRIEVHPVVVTPQRPRGVWQIDSVDLSRLLDFFHHQPTATITNAAQHLVREPSAITNAVKWLTAHGLLSRPTHSPDSTRT